MPTYLLHGFRWPRPLVRIHIILQNLDDAAAEWLMAPPTTRAMLGNFKTLYPQMMEYLPDLRFIEQYDPEDESADSKSQPYAYVADIVHEVKLGIEVDDVRGKGVSNEAWGSMVELRDKIAPGEKVAWYIVVCGDVERWAPPTMTLLEGSNGNSVKDGSNSTGSEVATAVSPVSPTATQKKPKSRLKKLFGGGGGSGQGKGLKKSRSNKTLDDSTSSQRTSNISHPPLPPPNGLASRDGSTYTPNSVLSPARSTFQSPPRTALQSPTRTAVQSPPRTAVQSPPQVEVQSQQRNSGALPLTGSQAPPPNGTQPPLNGTLQNPSSILGQPPPNGIVYPTYNPSTLQAPPAHNQPTQPV